MPLQCGIVGLSNSGKTTLFNCISSNRAESSAYAFSTSKSNVGIIKVPDPRLNILESLQTTEKVIPTTVEIVDIPGLAKGSSRGEGVGNKFLADIRNTDAIIHVLRCFDDDSLAHIEGSVNPVRDIGLVDFELQVKDLESVEKKILKVEKLVRAGEKNAKRDLELLNTYRLHLEDMKNARDIDIKPEEKEVVRDIFLLTDKPVMYVCNVDDASAISGNKYVEAVRAALGDEGITMVVVAGKLESDIAELDDEDDRAVFLEDAGLEEPGVNKLVRAAYGLLQLQTFFTVGPKEIRAWTIRKGMTAPQAAGVIHSDLERGFIRAEVMRFADFTQLKSEQACRVAGKFHVEGKNYVVGDGDILHIRFNV